MRKIDVDDHQFKMIRAFDLKSGMILSLTKVKGQDARAFLVREVLKTQFQLIANCIDDDGTLSQFIFSDDPTKEVLARILV